MCFIEYNWTAGVYSFRIGDRFTDWRGIRSLPTLKEWRAELKPLGFMIEKVDSRTWKVAMTPEREADARKAGII